MFTNFMKFFLDLLQNIPAMFEWLITPLAFIQQTLGLNVAPIYLLCGVAAIVAGFIRAIT